MRSYSGVPMQGSPSHPVVEVKTEPFEWALCLPK